MKATEIDHIYQQERHRAISLNATGGYYNFSNIRYGVAPVDDLRFRAPVAPTDISSAVVNNGSVGRVCPQSTGNWSLIAQQFYPKYLSGQSFDYDTAMAALPSSPMAVSSDPRTTEDCLFLDVLAPQKVFKQNITGLPVLVYGGGYSSGEKTGNGKFNPAGLLHISNASFVYVAMNYRDNIHLFGGDKTRVTVMGGSAGAGSIMHHIASSGGADAGPFFNQAIMLSPAFLPSPTLTTPEASFRGFLDMLGVSSLAEARQLDSEALIAANAIYIYSQSPYGSNLFGPAVDGALVPALLGQSLMNGSFHHNVRIMVSHNMLEGLLFTNPTISTTTDYTNMLEASMPDIPQDQLEYINGTLYPGRFNGTYGYTSEFQRALVTIQDSTIVCNTNYLAKALSDQAYSLNFKVSPGIHGQETSYVFQNGVTSGVNTMVADALQQYIVSFVMDSMPTSFDGTPLPTYGTSSRAMMMATTGLTVGTDDASNARCQWWQQGLYA
ncbi:putative carboxylesterase family protein [Phaeoacremonium minimum UCRPA7]|uniref:Carboxylic ester hydrolase n=1 Tax=Phaeoacremonium minimum (strain UCR-PA7) TaxID=1286976 RepID=R8BSX1_PHAM7|nr:putative carboxylesterase family protein [Phaeoacremonium minimum UCRPA7]EOO02370.1 putative carboxylesterase family protein [Phaeoacremonium minimum UCRPA7]